MTTPASKEQLITELDRVVQETLAYFAGPGRTTTATHDRWQAKDVLQHFLDIHDATACAIRRESGSRSRNNSIAGGVAAFCLAPRRFSKSRKLFAAAGSLNRRSASRIG